MLQFAYIQYNRQGSVFVSQVLNEVAEIVGICLGQATTKHVQTIGVLKWAHATFETFMKKGIGRLQERMALIILYFNVKVHITYRSSFDVNQPEYFLAGMRTTS